MRAEWGVVTETYKVLGVLWSRTGVTPGEAPDATAPGDVTNLTLYAGDEAITVLWDDPTDEDLTDIIVSWEPGSGESDPVSPGAESYEITGLTNDTEYTVTVKARDEVENASDGVNDTATPVAASATGGYAPRSPLTRQRDPIAMIMGGT